MTDTAAILWHHPMAPGSDIRALGWAGSHEFKIRFRDAADGRCIDLRIDGKYAGSFRTVGAAKRHARKVALCH